MEEYNKIYPELPKEAPKEAPKEPPKDGNAFRLQQSCRVLENLEKEAKHYASVRKKYKRCYNLLSRTSTLSGTLSFCLSGSGVGTAFSGVGLPLAASLGGLGLICGVLSVITGEAGKNVSRKVTKHEKTVSICESILITLKIVLCHYRNDSKPDIPKQILLISKQEISSGNQIYFFTAKRAKGQLCLTTTEKISDRVFSSQKR